MAIEVSRKDLPTLNRDLRELQQIKIDLEKAKRAGIEGMEELCDRCDESINRITKLKEVYFPNEK